MPTSAFSQRFARVSHDTPFPLVDYPELLCHRPHQRRVTLELPPDEDHVRLALRAPTHRRQQPIHHTRAKENDTTHPVEHALRRRPDCADEDLVPVHTGKPLDTSKGGELAVLQGVKRQWVWDGCD